MNRAFDIVLGLLCAAVLALLFLAPLLLTDSDLLWR